MHILQKNTEMEKSKFEFSALFINKLKKILPQNVSIVDEIAETLGISNDSVYRRIRGEKALTLDEVMLLCKKYKVTLDIMSNKANGKVTFAYKSIGNDPEDLDSYLKSVLEDFELLKGSEYVHLNFAAEDIPLFHHLEYKYITPFKFFYWKKAVLNDPLLEGKRFDPELIKDSTKELASKIAQCYVAIASTEVWNEDTINSTLSQIKYFWEAGLFYSKDDALKVCEDLILMIDHLKSQTELGVKFSLAQGKPLSSNQTLDLYVSEVQIGNNSLFIQADKVKSSFLSFNNFNSLFTYNLEYCVENERWINNLIKKSNLISSVSEKQRYRFFKVMTDRVNQLINTIYND
jgi:predicted DNA-binding protein YlxM (UPF0122 family)